ncbi:hypothetical protein [Staphylococcus phage LY01]|nr:hypothetical protein [Staphylococcus phage LY01]
MNTKIIAAFPGTGKSYIKNNITFLKTSDSDLNSFSWSIKDGKKVKDPRFPKNYIHYIKSLYYKNVMDYIFVSTHKEVIQELIDSNLDFVVVYPKRSDKNLYLERYKEKGSDSKFIELLDNMFDSFVDDIEDKIPEENRIELNHNEYLANVLDKI